MRDFILQFLKTTDTYPNHAALCLNNQVSFSYAELADKASSVANLFRSYGLGPGNLIAIKIEKSPEYVVALLAAWMCGAAFVPIDPSLPPSRQQFILEQANPHLIVYYDFNTPLSNSLPKGREDYSGTNLKLTPMYLHGDDKHLYPQDLAYIVFTSGSTGQPKGVMVSHKGLMNVLEQQIRLFQIAAGDRALFYLSTQFDASISDIGTVLLSGATLCIESGERLALAVNLPKILEEQQITHIDMPPALLHILDINSIPKSLKTIIIGGEVCSGDLARAWSKKIRLINVYGPTEATICTSMIQCTESFINASIGLPIDNIDYALYDDQLQSTQTGELYIAGQGVALGYLNNDELTQRKFITLDNKRYYRTGDLVRKNETGQYIYLGRIDRQFKLHGQLIEPEEIEAVLRQHVLVRAAAAFDKMDGTRKQLIAAVEASGLTGNMLRYFLQSRLPSWMIPDQVLVLDELPRTINDKIDYNLLRQFPVYQLHHAQHTEHHTQVTKKLQSIWQEALELPNEPLIHDDLFDVLGANSLDLIKIIVYSERYGIYCSAELLRSLRTIDELSRWPLLNNSEHADFVSTDVLKKEALGYLIDSGVPKAESKYVFITGATGFVGIHILGELFLKTNAPIFCLVRAQDKEQALAKIKNTAKKYQIHIDSFIDRLHPVVGDLSLPQLGLNQNEWNVLAQDIGVIYHCAAEVNMVKSFAELKDINLNGTKEIARLSLQNTRKKLYYLSTLSVFVATDNNSGICKEDDNLECTQRVYGGYAQSKWAAEYFLLNSSLDLCIFRLGLITGHSESGLSSEHDYLSLFVLGLKELQAVPADNWDKLILDVTPVDYAAKAIVHLSINAVASCFHIANPHKQGFSLQMIVEAMQHHGITLTTTDKSTIPTPSDPQSPVFAAFMALCRLDPERFDRYRTMDLFQATGVEFDQSNTLKGLCHSGITCPKANEYLLNHYICKMLGDARF
jgi:amino acid adenylation domain-containing protein/thioester reductase-like protein